MTILRSLLTLTCHIIANIVVWPPSSFAQDLPWPYNLPPHVKYYPEQEAYIKRDIGIEQRLQQQAPVGIKKLTPDPGQKFFLEYWTFESDEERYIDVSGNASTRYGFEPPFPLHSSRGSGYLILPRYLHLPLLGRISLQRRDFVCPAGSQACTGINRPDSCCSEGSTCQIIQDTGLGDVGCCPSNEVCGGSLSYCPGGGYTSCPNNPGGGCCLPNYQCLDVGCILTSTTVVTVASTTYQQQSTSTSTTTSTSMSTSTVTETSTTVVPPPVNTPSSSSAPPSTTITVSSTSQTTSLLPNTLVCSSGYRSCPASLGGGCCPTSRACGRGLCPALTSTNTFIAPGRPTSDSASASTTKSDSSSSLSISGCPTGFYACSAVYQGGCCRTGRNCDTTSCPSTASITVVDGSTITAVAPTGSGISSANTRLTGPCASGWSTCAQTVGGGCCLTGYACGMTACTATANNGGQGSQVGKIAPNTASMLNKWSLWSSYGHVLASIAIVRLAFA